MEHRAVARQTGRESLVLLKNDNHVQPLSRDLKPIHVAGRAADDLGLQCGGWTIGWQGKPGAVTEGGTTLLAALRQQVGAGFVISARCLRGLELHLCLMD